MSEMTVAGALIEMNAKSVMTADAVRTMVFGAIAAGVFAVLMIAVLIDKDKKSKAVRVGVCAFMFALGVALMFAGNSQPRIKEIRYCANGPIQIEQVAAKYDIISIDGKEIVVRER